jgi:hypothetical protein
MTDKRTIHLGYELGTGAPIAVPLLNLAVTGQTQESGKTTTLEALATRSGAQVITFVTKRGEGSFADGRRIQPYFRDRADWQFVDAILEAALGEKNKYLRQFLIPICRKTKTLADVQAAVRTGLKKAHGQKEGALIQLDAYLELIVPDIARARLAPSLDLAIGVNVMDVSDFSTPMQMLFVQSALDWVNERERNTVVVIPEAWEFIPEGKGSPVKSAAVTLVRKGSGIGNRIWVDRTPEEATALRQRNTELEEHVAELSSQVRDLTARLNGKEAPPVSKTIERPAPTMAADHATVASMDAIYAEIKRRALADPGMIAAISIARPEIEVRVEKKRIEIDGTTSKGRIAKLLAEGFYDGGKTNSATRTELKRTGADVNNANIDRVLTELLRDGFLTLEGGSYLAVAGAKVNIVEA